MLLKSLRAAALGIGTIALAYTLVPSAGRRGRSSTPVIG